MNGIKRRNFIKILAAGPAMLSLPASLSACKKVSSSGRVVIIGGGFGGTTCAKYLHKFDPTLDITLITAQERFVTCPFSNAVLGNLRDLASISHGYMANKGRGIKVIQALAQDIDASSKKISLNTGQSLEYDRLVISPGIDFKWDSVEGMSANDTMILPHAWQGGPQTTLLHKQLVAMPDGGVVVIAPPGNPFRCPPGPYERASLIAHYLKQHKPRSKILILDAKDKFSKQGLFMQGWEKLYPGMIEWVAGSHGGRIDQVDVANHTLVTETGDRHRGDVVNFIPPQKAASIVHRAGLSNSDGWCPVNQRTFESSLQQDVHIIGDASIAGKMPKSGFAANSQGKVCAAAIVSAFNGSIMPEPSYVNTCYSLVGPDYGISVAAVYRYALDKGIYKVKGSGGISPTDADNAFRQKEARYASGWYDSITADTFG